jgi:monoamine oxidase
MNRRDFLAVSAMLGVGAAVGACSDDEAGSSPTTTSSAAIDTGDSGRFVTIIGAGAAGMAAGHLLAQRGIDFQILEAGPTYGGRIKHTHDFVDFPIALGGEWLHAREATLGQIVNDESIEITTRMHGYADDDPYGLVTGTTVGVVEMGRFDDLKFVGSSWLDFFDEHIVSGIADRMVFDTQITHVDYSSDPVTLFDATGHGWFTDRVIVTVPMKILQDGDIGFVPALPSSHRDALAEANIWTGMKVFLEFTEAFYPVFTEFIADGELDGQRSYYDAAYGQESDANVLGLFLVGEPAEPYQALDPGDELRDYILAELDELFDGAASRTYIQHISQNWANEPFIKAAYLEDNAFTRIPNALAGTLDDRVYFAGCSYTREPDWSSVHTAVRSARDAVDELTAR